MYKTLGYSSMVNIFLPVGEGETQVICGVAQLSDQLTPFLEIQVCSCLVVLVILCHALPFL